MPRIQERPSPLRKCCVLHTSRISKGPPYFRKISKCFHIFVQFTFLPNLLFCFPYFDHDTLNALLVLDAPACRL